MQHGAAPPGSVGDPVGLCLLVDFADAPATIPRDEIERFCNQPGYRGFGNNGSVHDVFVANSIGRCRCTLRVAPCHRAAHPRAYYADTGQPAGQRARLLVAEVLQQLLAGGFDFGGLALDDSGHVRATHLLCAGDGLPPQAARLDIALPLQPGAAVLDCQVDALGDGPTLGRFCRAQARMLCGPPALGGAGAFCLTGSGAALDATNPPQLGAPLKWRAGWAQALVPLAAGQRLELPATGNHFALLAGPGDECLVVENRQRSGRDAALPAQGLLLWQVDAHGDRGLPPQLLAGDTPPLRWWDGSPVGLALQGITPPGSRIGFRVVAAA